MLEHTYYFNLTVHIWYCFGKLGSSEQVLIKLLRSFMLIKGILFHEEANWRRKEVSYRNCMHVSFFLVLERASFILCHLFFSLSPAKSRRSSTGHFRAVGTESFVAKGKTAVSPTGGIKLL